MREVEFQEVYMENFGPYIDPMGYKFEKNKLTLITGPNGIGKTMSLDALPFTLFGVTSKKAKGDDVVNNKIGKNCKTIVNFKINEDQYIVTRYHKYTKIGNTVILNKNGTDIKKGQKEVLPEIEKLLCSQKAFMNTLMFGQKVKDFFTDLVDSDKKEIFRKILGLEQYVLYYKQTDNDLKDNQKTYDDILTQIQIDQSLMTDASQQITIITEAQKKFDSQKKEDVKSFNNELTSNQNSLKLSKQQLQDLNIERFNIDLINKNLIEIQSSFKNITQKYETLSSELNQDKENKILEIRNNANKAELDIKELTSKGLELINSEITEIIEKNTEQTTSYKENIHNNDLETQKIRNNIDSIKERIEEINTGVIEAEISICPTCEQAVNKKVKEKLIEKIKLHMETITSLDEELFDYSNARKTIALELKNINDESKRLNKSKESELDNLKKHDLVQCEEVKTKLKDLLEQINNLSINEGDKITKQLNDETELLKNNQNNFTLQKNEYDELVIKKIEIDKTINNTENSIIFINDKIQFTKDQKFDNNQLILYIVKKKELTKSLIKNKKEVMNLDEKIEILNFWKIAFSSSGIPSMLIDEAIPFMNIRISEYLEKITNGRYIVSFDTLNETKAGIFRDKISVHVVDTQTQANSRIQLSGGQTRIIDIAIILTLGDLQNIINDVTFNLLLFDEIFDALDYDNAGRVAKVLNQLKLNKTIYIISHQHQDQLDADEILSLT